MIKRKTCIVFFNFSPFKYLRKEYQVRTGVVNQIWIANISKEEFDAFGVMMQLGTELKPNE